MKERMIKTVARIGVSILLLLLNPISSYAFDGDSTSMKVTHVIGMDFRPGYTLPTHNFFKGENASEKKIGSTLSGHLKYGFKFSPHSRQGKTYPHAIQGIGITYNTFFNPSELGNPFSAYLFQTSRIASITPKLSFDYEWNFGAAFGWKKYDEEHNPFNEVVGSKTNAYINLGFLLNAQISSNTYLRGGINVTHYSNGNTSYPNAGVNTIGVSVGVAHFLGNPEVSRSIRFQPQRSPFLPHITYDLIAYGATRKKGVFPEEDNPMLVPGSFGIAGINFNPLYNFNKYFRAGISLDLQYDESANIGTHIANEYIPANSKELKFYRPSFREQFSAGLSLRAEIVMPIFSINLGIGKNFLCKGEDTNSFYQTFVLKTNITDKLFLHTGYQLYRFKDPNNVMMGLGYRFNSN